MSFCKLLFRVKILVLVLATFMSKTEASIKASPAMAHNPEILGTFTLLLERVPYL